MRGFMMEIAPILTTQPIKKIKRVVHEGQKKPEQSQAEEPNSDEGKGPDDSEPQHIDEIA